MNLADLDATLGRVTVDELLTVYRQDLATRLAQLRAATTPDEVRHHAHGLRSGAASFGAMALADAARDVERGDGSLAAVEHAASALDAALATRLHH
ncbi:Hpt domain-containing protein [Solirubrobacter phytolaccae]|uniref:Hpt domain-containing protein n=1 Tax=Solirubrobacter phytolaccae TaxID=1404360 RepID=A0A9X3NC52_9ACTN|nr:Hpt domain-containing protein [Solirubrobacter phytolaccae]MDA0182047.1 Hpt domain-containing protein [Solirubrobacter phytolaccae]